jgi:hypothetical protein
VSLATNRLKLLAILALFLFPLLWALLIFKGQLPLLSKETINQGTLIEPPVAIDWSAAESVSGLSESGDLEDSWVILIPVTQPCTQSCLQKITGLRQVHRASGREQQRIELVLLSEGQLDEGFKQELLTIYERFHILADPSGSLHESLRAARPQSSSSPPELVTYLVDPLANIMMAYETADSEIRLSKDLKRLLTWSKQGND